MVLILLAIAASGMAGSTNGPIEVLVTRLAGDHFWQNGKFPAIDLPETATPDEVLSHLFKMTTFDKGRASSFKILEAKSVTIRGSLPDTYTAVLVNTDLGPKIVLLKYIEAKLWWTKVYDAETLPNLRLERSGVPPATQP